MPFPEHESWFHQIVTRIRCSLDLTAILEAAVEEVRSFLDLDRVKIYHFDTDWHGEVIAESRSQPKSPLPSLLGLHFPSRDIPLQDRDRFIKSRQRVVVNVSAQIRTTNYIDDDRTGQALHQSDIRYAPLDPCHAEYLQNMGVDASLVLPILHNGQLWGLLACHHSQPRHFQEQELQMAQLVVDQLSIAIAQSHLLSAAHQQTRNEAAINQISTLLHSPLPLAEMRQAVLEKLVNALNCDGGRLYVIPEPTGTPAQLYITGSQPHSLDLEQIPLWQSLLTTTSPEDSVLAHSAPTVNNPKHIIPYLYTLNDLYEDQKLRDITWAFSETPIRSLLLIPLRYQHQCVGIVTLFRHSINTEKLWAGQDDRDRRQHRPRSSFDLWKEIQQDCAQPWTTEEQKLAQGLGIHLYLSIVQRRVENTIRHQASHDALTGLPNRLLFSQQLEIALVKGLQQGKLLAVIFLDLDGFKHINDTLGHATGDRLLQKVARRLRKLLQDRDTVARWGSDEFTILTEIADTSQAQTIAQKLLEGLKKPLILKNQNFYIKASLGIAIAPFDGDNTETLLKNADAAMHSAKQLGRNHYQLYTPAIGSESHNRLLIENSLYRALEQQEFVLHYQPQIDCLTGKIVGAEALIRWQYPNGQLMSPFHFIPIAEETGLILPIGEWVLKTACAQAIAWQDRGLPPIQVSVNFTAHQFLEPHLVDTIVRILDRTGLAPQWLDVEITEGTAMQDVEFTIAVLKKLQKLGIKVSLDDFGTGYSSLWTLKRFPLNTIKIDKSFIDDIVSDSSQVDLAILKAVIEMARGLNLKTVAEGIETSMQRDLLQSLNCDRFQGYLFSKPVPASVLETQLSSNL
ncbi:MAG: EAL domain-containing protein [Jaaginema sp. PMC 1079.18]|nr:EAL domain-containing protein [Jaaginema sp. PMC 1080.18]MEC4853036.1 EAL domain-containing protein [Jaaginema sp. PMC 1079.18]MEC4865795.1 EAL domain-containing protein [Jaaginema sp. PMC 1078.18]